MNESGFTRAVNKKLSKNIYCWKVSDRYTGGVPDVYYSSKRGDMWIEYKYLHKLPKRVKPNLSSLQIKWLKERHSEGRNVFVVVGSPTLCLLYEQRNWEKAEVFQTLTRDQLIAWIDSRLG